jgi:hypothetical protein
VAVSLNIARRLTPTIVAVMADQSYALAAEDQGIKNLNVLKRRRGYGQCWYSKRKTCGNGDSITS